MHSKLLSLAAFASLAAAQSVNLTAAIASNPNLSNLTQYLGFYPQIVQTLSSLTNITLLAPSNEAFTKLLSGSGAAQANASDESLITALFTYHVLDGTYFSTDITSKPAFIRTVLVDPAYTNLTSGQVVEAVMSDKKMDFYSGLLQKATVTQANINFTGGVIHVIDNFLTIPQNISTTLVELDDTSALGAIAKSGLASGPLPANLTAFIPNNAAFQAIGSALANVSMEQLQGILDYHIVGDAVVYSTMFTNGFNIITLTDGIIHVTINDDNVFVNSAKVVIPDVLIKEGVVHVIDNVLNPLNPDATPNVSASTQKPAFSGASSASNAPFTSGIPTPSSAIASPTATASGAGGASASLPQSESSPLPTSTTPSVGVHAIHGFRSGAIAGIAVGAAAAAVLLLLLGFCLIRRRHRTASPSSAGVNRTESTGYKKAELEGSIIKSTFPKAELPVTHENIPATSDDFPVQGLAAAGTARPSPAYQEMAAVSIRGQPPSHHQVQWSSGDPSPLELASANPTESSQSGPAAERLGLPWSHNEGNSSPKYTAVTESSTHDQAVVDASQLNKLKAEERELAEYIEAHETLQKLKNEHVALQARINAAEQRAHRSKVVGKD